MPRIPPSRAGAGLFVALSLLLAVPGGSAERVGTVRWEGVKDKDRSLTKVESAILRQDPRAAAAVLSRTSVHLFVAEGRASWDRDVAPLLSDALQSGPQAVARLASAMPDGIATAGPNIDGGVVTFALPGKRGEGVMAIRFPDLLDRSRTDSEVVDSPWPNRGRFVAGVDVEADRDADIVGVYVPSRPKGLSRGAPPDVRPKELPRDGRGDLVIFRGKGASGDDAESLRALSQRFAVERLTAEELATRTGVDVAPVAAIRRAGQLAYVGGYYRTPSPVHPQLDALKEVFHAKRVMSPLPIYGCSTDDAAFW